MLWLRFVYILESFNIWNSLKMASGGNLVKALKLASAYSAGLFAGGGIFLRSVDHPTRMNLAEKFPDGHRAAVHHFKFLHNHVERMQVPLITTSIIGSTAVFFLSKGHPKRSYWLAGAGVLALVFPLSGAHINPKYREPMCTKTDETANRGPEHVQHMLRGWSGGQFGRATLGSLGFLIILGALI